MQKNVLGHIDCPTCGASGGMRITHDKNSHPFGYCETGCGQQLRVGGNPARVRAFVARYPWAGTVTVTAPPTQEPPPADPPENPVTGTEPTPPAPRRASWVDAVSMLGVKHG